MKEHEYLVAIPKECEDIGICKVLIVRKGVIHLKHILSEIFVRKTIDVEDILKEIGFSLFSYMSFITNRLRKVHHFSRTYKKDFDCILSKKDDSFFKYIEQHEGLNNVIVLDFDGVVTKNSFHQLYKLCIQRGKVVICSANPTITSDYFLKHELPLPNKIYSMKGKLKKINQLLQIHTKHDNVFYVDDESKYLKIAWIFGIYTYQFVNNKIKLFTLNTK